MKKRLIIILLISVVIISGCGKNNTNLDVALNKGNSTSICKKVDDSDGIKITSTTTTNYDKDKYAINMKVKAIYEFSDKKTFDFYAEESKNTADTYEKMDSIVYKYEVDKNKMIITTVLGYQRLDINNEEKENYTLKKIVEDSEKEGGKCQFTGITREDVDSNNN